MEKFKKRFSIDAPIPFSTVRRKSEPVIFQRRPSVEPQHLPTLSRRYSTALHTPVATNIGRRSFDKNVQDYSSNFQVRKLSMDIALQKALTEEYGHTAVYHIPLIYTPPPAILQTSTYVLHLTAVKPNANKNKLKVIKGRRGLKNKIECLREVPEMEG